MYALGLELAGYRPLTACDADSALNQLRNGHPAAVVTDPYLVGGHTGWDLINTLEKDPATRTDG
jgi:CheY-like chemotaxis protein